MQPTEMTDRNETIRRFFQQGQSVPLEELADWLLTVVPDCHQTRAELSALLIADNANRMQASLGEITPRWKALANKYLENERIGNYRLIELVGRGASGFVFRAALAPPDAADRLPDEVPFGPQSNAKTYAVKIHYPWGDETDDIRFQREQRALRTINHAAVARFVEAGTDAQGTAYLVTEFIDGLNLEQRLRNSAGAIDVRTVPLSLRVKWFRMICEGVAAAHQHLILHRDLKPGNVIITDDDRAVVTDFGLAKKVLSRPHTETQVTTPGQVVGTLAFMSPEQVAGEGDLRLNSDVYGLGAMLYFLLTGRPPHRLSNLSDTCEAILHKTPLAPRSLDRSIPKDLETICLHALKKDPALRYPSADAMLQDVACYEQGEPIIARATSEWRRFGYWTRRNPLAASSMLFALVVTLLGSIVVSSLWIKSRSATRNAERNNQQLLATIDEITSHIRSTEFDPSTLDLRASLLRTITASYDQLNSEQTLNEELLKAAAGSWFKLGRAENLLGNRPQSQHAYRQAEQYFQQLVDLRPDELQYQFDMFHVFDSQRRLAEALDVIKSLLQKDASNPYYQDAYCNTVLRQTEWQAHERQFEQAVVALQGVLPIAEDLAEKHPEKPIFQRKTGQIYDALARFAILQGNVELGLEFFAKAIAQSRRVLELRRDDEAYHYDCTMFLVSYLAVAVDRKDSALLNELLRQLDSVTLESLQSFPKSFEAWQHRADFLLSQLLLATADDETDRIDETRKNYEEFLRIRRQAIPNCPHALSRLAWLLSSPSLNAQSKRDEWSELLQQISAEDFLQVSTWLRGDLQLRLGQFAEAAESYRKMYKYSAAMPGQETMFLRPGYFYRRAADDLTNGREPVVSSAEIQQCIANLLLLEKPRDYLLLCHRIMNIETEISNAWSLAQSDIGP